MSNTATVEPLPRSFGAVVTGIDLRELDDSSAAWLREVFHEFALLVLPAQHLTPDEQNDVARHFGELEFAAAPITNVRRDGSVLSDPDHDTVKSLRGNEGWHHDSTYMPVQALGAVFSAEIVPPSGSSTGFADMRAGYDALDDALQSQLAGLSAHHSLYYSMGRADLLPTRQDDGSYALYGYHDHEVSVRPLVKHHPATGRPNVVAGRHAHDIVGMDASDSERFLDTLNERLVSDPNHVHHHEWTVGDTVIWDNRRLMHCAVPFDMTEPRRMWHTRIAGDPLTESALNHR